MDPELIPALPEDLSGLSDEQLADLRERLLAVEEQIYTGDEDAVGTASNEEVIAAYEDVVEAIRTVNAEITRRDEESTAVSERMSELRSGIRDDEEPEAEAAAEESEEASEDADAGDEEAEVVEGEVVEEQEAVTASSRPFRGARRMIVRDRDTAPEQGFSLVAAADIPGFASGSRITPHDLAVAMINKRRAFVSAPDGYREKVVVASAISEYPDERFLADEDPSGLEKIKSVIGEKPGSKSISELVAAGGICAPVDVRYAWDVLGVTSTPVWDSMPKFGAARGGLRFPVIPTIADITTATTTVTAAQDAAGGTTSVKDCQEVTCPSFSEVLVDILARCLEFPNLTARTYPEMVTGWNQLLAIAFAQELEGKILTSVKSLSTAVTTLAAGTSYPTDMGAIGVIYPVLIQAASRLRSHMRLDPNAAMRALIPSWVLDELVADWHRRNGVDPFEKTKAEMAAHFNAVGIQPTFYLDSTATGGQVMGAQTAGAFVTYPTSAEVFLYPEGTFLGLDAGQLDLGVVRDSSLNSTNKYQIFSEQFLNLAKVGGESVALTIPLGPTGAAALDVAATVATSQ